MTKHRAQETEFTGEGSNYILTYGAWVDAQNAILRQGSGEVRSRTFKYLSIEFEEKPAS